MPALTLYITNKNYSSWSIRPWLVMRHFGIVFEERMTPLDAQDKVSGIRRISGTGKVPCLIAQEPDGDLVLWESLAILEYLAELFGDLPLWPGRAADRARARVIANEMHAGFTALRRECPMNLRRPPVPLAVGDDVIDDVRRVVEIWRECLARSGGPFLFGEFGIADAMFAPVYSRIISYRLSSDPVVGQFGTALSALPAWQEWITAAMRETAVIDMMER